MKKQTYKYTSNMPSNNPFTWYFDDSKSTAFATSKTSELWSKQPKIGDTITLFKSGEYNETIEEVHINGVSVFKWSQEIQNKMDEEHGKQNIVFEISRHHTVYPRVD